MYGLYLLKNNNDTKCLSVERLLRSMGANGRLTGFFYLIFIIEFLLNEESNKYLITKSIYPMAAKKYNVSPASVEHAIRTVINSCWKFADHGMLDHIAGVHLERIPTNSEFIDIVLAYMKYQNNI